MKQLIPLFLFIFTLPLAAAERKETKATLESQFLAEQEAAKQKKLQEKVNGPRPKGRGISEA